MSAKFFGAVLAAGLLTAAVSAGAQTTTTKQTRECRLVNGIESCTLTTNYGDRTSKQTCDYPPGSVIPSECTNASTANAPSREIVRYSATEEARKAAVRAASGYRDPPGTAPLGR